MRTGNMEVIDTICKLKLISYSDLLSRAINHNQSAVVKFCLRSGAYVESLNAAVNKGYAAILALLLRYGGAATRWVKHEGFAQLFYEKD